MTRPITTTVICITALCATAAPAAVTLREALVIADVSGGFVNESFPPRIVKTATTLAATPLSATKELGDRNATSSYRSTAGATISLVNAAEGTLSFYASSEATTADSGPQTIARGSGVTSYSFNLSTLSRLSFDYSIERTIPTTGGPSSAYLRLYEVDDFGVPGATFLNESDVVGAGSRSYLLGPGSYALGLSNNVSKALTVVTSGSDGESISGRLDFAIAAVPEPASWATMALGFAVVGAAARRRRSTAAA